MNATARTVKYTSRVSQWLVIIVSLLMAMVGVVMTTLAAYALAGYILTPGYVVAFRYLVPVAIVGALLMFVGFLLFARVVFDPGVKNECSS